MSSGAHGGGPIRTELFWSRDLACLVRIHSGPTKQWLYLTVETGPRAPACGDLIVSQRTMAARPAGCALQAETRSRELIPLPHLAEDAGLRCWQTPKARRWSFAKTKERVRLDYEIRRGRRRPAERPPRRPASPRPEVRCRIIQLDLFAREPLPAAA